ncbi:uncharacterized protein B0I36DRAFT_409697 [Microdochium trichocladiopsis]|uniref:Uncharacterized protein n=1 Tax=Microdochium trichocladiopsis TaxID=1682393 RepID=A0A9P9BQW4_9PEZI|nr:uncharacterized protein B0I36DRAFT_409697 [Microdochium trichocladiopsis]KAH7031338.1 hypothetical protein B0I36DRAFT_409697 [Microdochium trichocladiopsis]
MVQFVLLEEGFLFAFFFFPEVPTSCTSPRYTGRGASKQLLGGSRRTNTVNLENNIRPASWTQKRRDYLGMADSRRTRDDHGSDKGRDYIASSTQSSFASTTLTPRGDNQDTTRSSATIQNNNEDNTASLSDHRLLLSNSSTPDTTTSPPTDSIAYHKNDSAGPIVIITILTITSRGISTSRATRAGSSHNPTAHPALCIHEDHRALHDMRQLPAHSGAGRHRHPPRRRRAQHPHRAGHAGVPGVRLDDVPRVLRRRADGPPASAAPGLAGLESAKGDFERREQCVIFGLLLARECDDHSSDGYCRGRSTGPYSGRGTEPPTRKSRSIPGDRESSGNCYDPRTRCEPTAADVCGATTWQDGSLTRELTAHVASLEVNTDRVTQDRLASGQNNQVPLLSTSDVNAQDSSSTQQRTGKRPATTNVEAPRVNRWIPYDPAEHIAKRKSSGRAPDSRQRPGQPSAPGPSQQEHSLQQQISSLQVPPQQDGDTVASVQPAHQQPTQHHRFRGRPVHARQPRPHTFTRINRPPDSRPENPHAASAAASSSSVFSGLGDEYTNPYDQFLIDLARDPASLARPSSALPLDPSCMGPALDEALPYARGLVDELAASLEEEPVTDEGKEQDLRRAKEAVRALDSSWRMHRRLADERRYCGLRPALEFFEAAWLLQRFKEGPVIHSLCDVWISGMKKVFHQHFES